MIYFKEIFIDFFFLPDEIVPQLRKIGNPFVFEDIIIASKPPRNLITLSFRDEVKMFD